MNLTSKTDNDFVSPSLRERFNDIGRKNQAEETDEFVLRNIGQHASRIGETVLGLPGNIKREWNREFGELGKMILPEESANINKEKEKKKEKPFSERSFMEHLERPPTSQELRENVTEAIGEELTGQKKYFEPRSKKEEIAGELTQDITSMFLPGTKGMRLATRIGAPAISNMVKQGMLYLGADPSDAEKAKMGVNLIATISGQSNPGQFAANRIAQAKSMIPDTATVHVGQMANQLMPLYNRITRGLGVPSKSRAAQGMQDLAGQVQNNRISFRSLLDARDNINEWIAEAGGWDIPAPTRDATLRNLNELKRAIIDTIETNMQTRFPQAAELYRTGYEAAAVTHQSNAISNFIEKKFGRKTASIGAKLLFPSLATTGWMMPKTAVAFGVLYPLYNAGKVINRVAKSPTLARYYQDVVNASVIGNAPLMIHSMQKLDKALAEDEKKLLKKNKRKVSMEEFKSRFKKPKLSHMDETMRLQESRTGKEYDSQQSKMRLDINTPEGVAIIDKLLQEAGGDPDVAEQKARDMGYEF